MADAGGVGSDLSWERDLYGSPEAGVPDAGDASGEVTRVWRRRARAGSGFAPRSLTPSELAFQRDRDETYRLAASILEEFGARLCPSRRVLAFLDAAGWMLSIGGDPRSVERMAEIEFRPGTNWREDPGGTARASAANDGAVAEVAVDEGPLAEGHAAGNLVEAWASWNCAAAAVSSPRSGTPAGFVAIAGPWPAHDAQARVAVAAIAHAVEERLRSAEIVRDQVVEYAFRTAAETGDGVFAVDRHGTVLAANDAARRRLAFQGVEVPISVREDLGAMLNRPPGSSDAEVVLEPAGGPAGVRLHASPVRYERSTIGAVVRVLAGAGGKGRRPGRGAGGAPAAVARYEFDDVRGESPGLRHAVALARMASRNELPVVLVGESGTGKELFAQAIHGASARGEGPFIAVNCGCIPAGLLEAELFGYEAGTFTGGRKEGNAGKFEEACGGTLFLDEVSELPPQAQTALLRVLQEREVIRLGGSSPRRVDIRVIAASNKGLSEEIKAGRFRSDLYFRLEVLTIAVPPLRERRSDVEPLAEAFLREAEAELGRTGLTFSEEALRALACYDWPGNVRELRNAVLRVAATVSREAIEVGDLPDEIRAAAGQAARAAAPPSSRGQAASALVAPGDPERDALLRALEGSAWNVARTAQVLQVSRMTLYRRLHKHHIQR
jgi:sigma-54 dependent transcriptional regulator, acetoin dehydrogenase operon transcriptional activator AcoR